MRLHINDNINRKIVYFIYLRNFHKQYLFLFLWDVYNTWKINRFKNYKLKKEKHIKKYSQL